MPTRYLFGVSCVLLSLRPLIAADSAVDFARDIQPIFKQHCLKCHDARKQQSGYRLDLRANAIRGGESDKRAIVAGKAADSELIRRVTSDDDDVVMPSEGDRLTAKQIDLLRKWIDAGAKWPDDLAGAQTDPKNHWAFQPPQRPAVPKISNFKSQIRNPIDAYVLAQLATEELKPSPEAAKTTLIRRLSLDLIGLPPTIEEVNAFIADTSDGAYAKLVERLLSSPHYGERWGRLWLDAARYADSDGFEKDKLRQVWFYRDWVVDAFNRDLPYDQFIIEQFAGDLLSTTPLAPGGGEGPGVRGERLPSPPSNGTERRAAPSPQPSPPKGRGSDSLAQDRVVATGFLRNSMINEEGGVDPEQFRMEAMFDRMDAIGKSVLGLTIQCSQCHNHKYDPLTQAEYYQLFAFLNNDHEANVAVYSPDEQMRRADIFRMVREIEDDLKHRTPDWSEKMSAWEETAKRPQPEWEVLQPEHIGDNGQRYFPQPDGSIVASGYAPTKFTSIWKATTKLANLGAFRLELFNDPNLPCGGPGRSIMGTCALTEFKVEVADAANLASKQQVKIVKATADYSNPERDLESIFGDKTTTKRVTGPIEFAIDGKNETAWGMDAGPGRRNRPRNAVFIPEKPVGFPGGTIVTISLAQNHGGWNSDDNQNNNLGRFRLSASAATDAVADPVPKNVRDILAIPRDQRTRAQQAAVFSHWRTTVAEWKAANDKIEEAWKQHPEGSTQLVLLSREMPRGTSILKRGDFLKPDKPVTAGVPAFLNPLPPDEPLTRLTFAKWLVNRRSPTTARAIVNRIWQAHFGTGLVSTSEDLGTQCEPPSHPELLDWLAVELMEPTVEMEQGAETRRRGDTEKTLPRTSDSTSPRLPLSASPRLATPWSLKHIHRLIVTSATYRQSSKVTPDLFARDPYNRLLARGPRFRVDAELVRDIALAASGLLNPAVGGPPSFPPLPEFMLLPPVSYGPKVWYEDKGPNRYRRAIYTFRYRSIPYPVLQTFDAPNGDFSCIRRSRSNTPLQALMTLNEPVFVECSQALALLTLKDGGSTDSSRLDFAFRRCVSRPPTVDEAAELSALLAKQFQRFSQPDAKPLEVALADPASAPQLPEGTTPAHLAAWTVVSRVLLNLDETITKE
ncbi:MAG: PSD1 domain-containing protein [Planctomycetales bacterium]|nr:PSD1 domain-containing protein [Planctomycetales bacterium]